jgi:hypothetical protein
MSTFSETMKLRMRRDTPGTISVLHQALAAPDHPQFKPTDAVVITEPFPDLPSHIPAVILHGVLTPEECRALVSAIPFVEGTDGYLSEREVSSLYMDRVVERYSCSDPDLSALIEERIRASIPIEIFEGKDTVCTYAGISDEWRFLRYRRGGHQGFHIDGREQKKGVPDVYSRMTVQMYLNNCESDFTGGGLRFFEPDMITTKLDYVPKAGDCVLFYQEDNMSDDEKFLGHEAMDVLSGYKYAMRCMVQYRVTKI